MRTIFILYSALFVAISVVLTIRAERYSRRVITRKGRNTDGQDVIFSETVIQERTGDGEPTTKEEEVKMQLSGHQRRFLRKRDIPRKVECAFMKPPINGFIVCRQQTDLPVTEKLCKANCIENYKFPDGSTVKAYNCTLQGDFWNHVDQPANCQPAKPGIGCDKVIEGKNQARTCVTYSAVMRCRSECHSGYKFPNGETTLSLLCRKSTGVYEPIDNFPDCITNVDKVEEETTTSE